MGLRNEVLAFLEVEGGEHERDEIEENTGDYEEDLDNCLEKLVHEETVKEVEGGYTLVE